MTVKLVQQSKEKSMKLNYPVEAEDRECFDAQIQKIVDSYTRQDAEKDLVKTICDDLKDAYGSTPASVKKLAKYVQAQSIEGLAEEVEEMTEVFNIITEEE